MQHSNPIRRLSVVPMEYRSEARPTRVDRYLGLSLGADSAEWTLADGNVGLSSLRLVDTSDAITEYTASATLLWHVLWVRDEAGASITVATKDQRNTWPIAPGDACLIPAGAIYRATSGQLAITIERQTRTAFSHLPRPPTHGTDEMIGHNRRTTLPEVDGLSVARWKLTEPLEVTKVWDGAAIVIMLAGKSVVRTETVLAPLQQGEAAIISSEANAMIHPDGLAYLLAIEAPANDMRKVSEYE